MGRVMGLVPNTLKSYPLWVYFQMYSPLKTKYLLKACCSPAWNSLRKPGVRGEVVQAKPWARVMIALTTRSEHAVPERIRFSLKGLSSVRAYEICNTVFVGLML